MKKKIVAALLAVIVFAVMLAGCGKSESSNTPSITTVSPDATAENAAETTTELRPDLPQDIKFDGYEFKFLNGNTADWMVTYAITAEEANGEALNDAIYKRNLATSEQFGVSIVEISNSGAASTASKSIAAGEDAYDCILITTFDAFTSPTKGEATIYANIPYIDLTKPWWVQNSIRDTSINGKVYYAISLFDTTHYDEVRGLMFNKTLRENYELDNPYQLVEDNKWVLDKMKEMGTAVALDIDGDGEWGNDDQYGYTSWSRVGAEALVYGVGAKLSVTKDSDDMPYFDLANTYNYDRYQAIADLYATPGFLAPYGTAGNHGGLDQFIAGKALFYNEAVGNTHSLRDMDADFGFIPSPKYTEEQEEYYHFGGTPYVMLIPVTASDLERTGIIIESLSFESVSTVVPAYYDIMLNGKIARDTESGPMLDIVFNTLSYPYQIAFDYCDTKITDMLWKNKSDFASYFAKYETTIQKNIDKAIDAYEAGNQ